MPKLEIDEERCAHGIMKQFCAYCSGASPEQSTVEKLAKIKDRKKKECPNWFKNRKERVARCHCKSVCGICGFRKHDAIHMPPFGEPPGSKPYGHEYK